MDPFIRCIYRCIYSDCNKKSDFLTIPDPEKTGSIAKLIYWHK